MKAPSEDFVGDLIGESDINWRSFMIVNRQARHAVYSGFLAVDLLKICVIFNGPLIQKHQLIS